MKQPRAHCLDTSGFIARTYVVVTQDLEAEVATVSSVRASGYTVAHPCSSLCSVADLSDLLLKIMENRERSLSFKNQL